MSAQSATPDDPVVPAAGHAAPAGASAQCAQIDTAVFARLSHLFRRAGTGATTQSLFGALYEARTAQHKEA